MIRNQIEAVVTTLRASGELVPSFLYGTNNELNLFYDKEGADKMPVISLYPMHPSTMELGKNSSVSDNFSIYMTFLTLTKFENGSPENEANVMAMHTLCKRFLIALRDYKADANSATYFSDIQQPRATPIYYSKDANLTGVSLEFRVKKRQDDYLLNC